MRGKVEIMYPANGVSIEWPVKFPIPRIGESVISDDGEGRVEDVRYFINENEIIGNNRILIVCTKDF